MPRFVATYTYTPDTAARDAVRPAHRDYLGGLDELLLSGPTDDEGALLIFDAKSAAELEEVLDEDPFYVEDLVVERSIVEWTPVLGPWRDPLGLD